jgi:hypothetical protein
MITKLITSLRTAVENGEGMLDKDATSHDVQDVVAVLVLMMRSGSLLRISQNQHNLFYLSYVGPIDTIPPPLYVPFIVSTKSISFIILSSPKLILCATTTWVPLS